MKQTKIVVSVSDRRCEVDFINQLYKAGANGFPANGGKPQQINLNNLKNVEMH